MTELGGQLPDNAKDMQAKIPGIGRYSAGAICSIAYNECAPVVSGICLAICQSQRATIRMLTTALVQFPNAVVGRKRPPAAQPGARSSCITEEQSQSRHSMGGCIRDG